MDPIRKILVPTDCSPHATEAFRVAVELAKATGAVVVVLHVSRPPAVMSDGTATLSVPTCAAEHDVWDRLRTDEETDVWDRLRQVQPHDPAVRVEHERIAPARQVGR